MTESTGHTHNWIWSDGENGRRSACTGCPETRDGWVTGNGSVADTDLETEKVRTSASCDECGCAPGHQRSCSRYHDRAVPRIPAPRPELSEVRCGHFSVTFKVWCRHPLPGHNGMHRSTPVLGTDSYCWDDTH